MPEPASDCSSGRNDRYRAERPKEGGKAGRHHPELENKGRNHQGRGCQPGCFQNVNRLRPPAREALRTVKSNRLKYEMPDIEKTEEQYEILNLDLHRQELSEWFASAHDRQRCRSK